MAQSPVDFSTLFGNIRTMYHVAAALLESTSAANVCWGEGGEGGLS